MALVKRGRLSINNAAAIVQNVCPHVVIRLLLHLCSMMGILDKKMGNLPVPHDELGGCVHQFIGCPLTAEQSSKGTEKTGKTKEVTFISLE